MDLLPFYILLIYFCAFYQLRFLNILLTHCFLVHFHYPQLDRTITKPIYYKYILTFF